MIARVAAVSLVFALSACPQEPKPVTEVRVGTQGEVSAVVTLEPFSVRLLRPDGTEVLRTLEGGAADDPYGAPAVAVDYPKYETQLLPGWDGYREQPSTWTRGTKAQIVAASEREAQLRLDGADGSVLVRVSVEGRRVFIDVEGARPEGSELRAFSKATLSFGLQNGERLFGMGERFASLNHRGHSLYSWAEEGPLGSGENTPAGPQNPYPNGPSMTYFPVPLFLSTGGYGVHVNTTYRSVVHFGSEREDALRVSVNAPKMQLTFYVGAPLEVLDLYTHDTGRPIIPSAWAFGTRRRINRSGMVDGVPEWQRMRELKIPITGIDDSMHFLPHRSELGREAELKTWVDTLHANGFKALAYYNPYVSATMPAAAEDYAYGKANGLFVKGPDGEPSLTWFISGKSQHIAATDLTNPAAVDWFHTLLSRARAIGYDGWMHDFGEYTARDAVFFDGRRGDEVHNHYPVLSAKAAHDFWMKERPDDFFFFVRSGYSGTQAYAPGVWGGDAEATFDETQGLPSALRSGLSLSMSGVPWWGSDVSGFKCVTDDPRDKEVYLRWIQLGAVSPIFMDQDACVHPTEDRTKWTLWSDAETTNAYREMSRLHTRLLPYFLVLAREANRTGIPAMRHPFLTHPEHAEAATVEDAFFLGPALFASPVVRRGVREKTHWLPPGRYVDLADFAVYEGGATVTLPAPLLKLPLLLVEGHLVPMLDPAVETLAEATVATVVTASSVADRLDVVVALGPGKEASLTLADGTVLRARRPATPPADSTGLSQVTAAQVADCSACFTEDVAGALPRLRLSSTQAAAAAHARAGVELSHEGGPSRRVRWEVLLLP